MLFTGYSMKLGNCVKNLFCALKLQQSMYLKWDRIHGTSKVHFMYIVYKLYIIHYSIYILYLINTVYNEHHSLYNIHAYINI